MSLLTSIASPKKSPSLGQNGPAILTDQNGNKIPVVCVVRPDASGNVVLPTGSVVLAGQTSQVTGLQDAPVVQMPGGANVPIVAHVGVDASGNPIPVSSASSFASTVQTGTGASQNIAHGLGVIPSKVLFSIYDTNGVALPHAMVEGAHDVTNLKVTVTASVKFKVLALV